MTTQTIGETLSIRLHAVEAAIDAALIESSDLMALLPRARAQAYLSAVTGQRAFDGAAASIVALTEARSHMIETHNTLAALARKMGLETLAVGPLDKPEDRPPNGGVSSDAEVPKVNKSLPISPEAC